MTIEQNLQSIAENLSEIVLLLRDIKGQPTNTPVAEAATDVKVKKVVAKPATPIAPDFMAEAAPVAAIQAVPLVEVTEEELRPLVKAYIEKTSREQGVEMIVKYGAKREKPMIKDVINKTGLKAEIEAFLKG